MAAVSPGDAFQRALYAGLSADSGVASASGGTARVFDSVPGQRSPNEAPPAADLAPEFPYIVIGEDQEIALGNEQLDTDVHQVRQTQIFSTIHIWDRSADDAAVVGKTRTKNIAAAIAAFTLSAPLAVTGWRVILQQFRDSRVFNDPDGLTIHGVVTLDFTLEPTGD